MAISALLFSLSQQMFWGIIIFLFGMIPIVVAEKNKLKHLLVKLFLLLFVFSSFYFYGLWKENLNHTTLLGDEQTFYGEIVSEPMITSSNQYSFEIKLNNGERLQAFVPP